MRIQSCVFTRNHLTMIISAIWSLAPCYSVLVSMVDIRVMLVRMPKYAMRVRMDVGFGSVPFKIMLVLVVFIMPMRVRMVHRLMGMLMLV